MSLKARIQESVKSLGRGLGLDIRKVSSSFGSRFARAIRQQGLNHVIDVGANVGQFGTELYAQGYRGVLLSFEPQPDAHAELARRAAASGQDWRAAPPMALSDTAGFATFQQFSATAMSSLLAPRNRMAEEVPEASVAQSYEVETARLENVLPGLWPDMPDFALKVDTQGAERKVLDGAAGVLGQARLVQLEASIGQLYTGQPLYHEIDALMRELGYALVDLEPGYRSRDDNTLLEFDVVYART